MPMTKVRTEVQQAARDTIPPPEPSKRPRGRPPKVRIEPEAPPSEDALARLEARARAPEQAADAAGQALRDSLAPYVERAAACLARLRPLVPAVTSRLDRLQRLEIQGEVLKWELILGGGSHLVRDCRSLQARLASAVRARDAKDQSTITLLERVPSQIAALTHRDVHQCVTGGMPHGCRVNAIKTAVEESEPVPVQVQNDLRALDELCARIDYAMTVRGAGVELVPPAPPTGPAARRPLGGDPEGDPDA